MEYNQCSQLKIWDLH